MATWSLDQAHSEIEFKVRHMMITNVKGQFQNFDITVTGESAQLEDAKINVTIQTDSINTKNEQRDQHLKSGDFFDVANYPAITFASTAIKTDGNDISLVGDLTIKGITKQITFDVEFGGLAKDPWGNQKAGYTVTGKINRQDYGLTWNAALETGGVMVSDDVKFQAEIQFILS
ncbi:YceI family protein [Sphingobacterium sp. SRCM116780]|uniref:YceI family protein n=1 Tax=Sphingobacterium sp. SRCM116780 TaxID=2907623 RepID=UPI001F3CC822|nr:YceI family protein [Sphingobacterium sp. SRCM116780]UIR57702.1 YceI family protein [Sphingobacterium sp. SRCM116780]